MFPSPTARVLLVAGLIALAGCRTTTPAAAPVLVTSTLQGDAARPADAAAWIRSELYFAVGRVDAPAEGDGAVAEATWTAFLDDEVTRRFPDGLTVLDAYGQWQSRGAAAPARLKSKVIVILHEDTPARRADIEAIRLAWKQATHHQSVLWSQEPVRVSF